MGLILLGLVLVWQPLTRASDEGTATYSVRSEASDQEMFGKALSTTQFKPMLSITELQPATGPITPSRLRIPSLNIDANVEQLGLRQDGAMDVPSNIWNVGWLSSGVQPGAVGNAVIDGHKDSVKGTAVFWDLGKLKVGERVYVSDGAGNELAFEVLEVASYGTGEAPLAQIFGSSEERRLNLITCDGTFVKSQYTYDKRLVVYTRLVTDND
jgi:LPXTG-site transpeptidase (sortase) family protein